MSPLLPKFSFIERYRIFGVFAQALCGEYFFIASGPQCELCAINTASLQHVFCAIF